MGFQGKHADTRRHNEKNEGDGFQADSLNTAGGYTYAFYFRNQPPPKKYIDMGLSPLHARTAALLGCLTLPWHTIYMDNLYISAKFLRIVFLLFSILITGVARQGGRGVPSCVKQSELTKQEEIAEARGTLKIAKLIDDPEMPNLICTSLYDQKPFYMMSTALKDIQWIKILKKIWSTQYMRYAKVPFYRLNIVNEYNCKMGQVDIGDQLRGSYRYDHWLRKRKWWWALWMWLIQMLETNAYILYCMFHRVHGYEPPLSHYQFLYQGALAWLEPSKYFPKKPIRSDLSQGSSSWASSVTHRPQKRAMRSITFCPEVTPSKNIKFTDATLCPHTGDLRRRLSHQLPHWPLPIVDMKTIPRCQLHGYLSDQKVRPRKQMMKCETCKVYLCIHCFASFHKIRDLPHQKKHLCGQLQDP